MLHLSSGDYSKLVQRFLEKDGVFHAHSELIRETLDAFEFCKMFGWTYQEYTELPEEIRYRFKAVLAGINIADEANGASKNK